VTLKLPINITNPHQIDSLILEVKTYAKWHSHAAIKQRAGAKTAEPPLISGAAEKLIEQWSKSQDLNAKQLDKLIDTLSDLKQSTPQLTITLAAPPSGQLQANLTDWCRKNLSENVLVSFHFNRTLLGGMVVQFGSHIYDWSFRRQLLAARDDFPKVLRSV